MAENKMQAHHQFSEGGYTRRGLEGGKVNLLWTTSQSISYQAS